jgi:hypothetical protein
VVNHSTVEAAHLADRAAWSAGAPAASRTNRRLSGLTCRKRSYRCAENCNAC